MPRQGYKKSSINTLVTLAQNGDSKALEEIIRREQKRIYVMFNHLVDKKEDVSDLTQEVLLKMAKSIYHLKEPKSFRYWLNKIVTNVFYDYTQKKRHKIVEIDEKKFNEIKDKVGCEPGEKCIFTEIEKLIKAALMTLPKDLRITLVLREYEGLSYEDISQLTNAALGTVKSRLSRARIKLQEELKDFI